MFNKRKKEIAALAADYRLLNARMVAENEYAMGVHEKLLTLTTRVITLEKIIKTRGKKA